MKKLLYLPVIFLFSSASVFAQYNLGIATSNWSGTNALYLNPALIADSRAKFTIDFISLNAGLDNSLGTLNTKGGIIGLINDGNTNNMFNYSGNNKFSLLAPYAGVRLPGVMVSINHRHSVALTTGIRGMNQFNNFDKSLYKTLTDTSYMPDGNLELTSNRFNYTAHVWSEVGLSYAGVIVDEDEHELKVGATLRYLGGIGYLGLKGNNLDARYKSANDTLFVSNSDMEFASNILSTRNAILNGVSNHNIFDEFFGSKDGRGFGADIGIVYDYIPKRGDTKYDKKNGKHRTDHSKNRYLLRFSASVMDIGSIKYSSNVNSNARVTGNGIVAGADFSKNVSNYEEFRSYAVSHGFTADTSHRDTRVYMPTRLHLAADVRLYRWFYVNALFIGNLANRQNFGNSYYNQFTITPRFDTRFFSVGTPVTYSALAGKVKVGLGVRLAGFFIGSDDMLALVSSNQSGFNFYVGGFVPFNKHKSKSDRNYWKEKRSDTTDNYDDYENSRSDSSYSEDAFVLPMRHTGEETGIAAMIPAKEQSPADRKEYMDADVVKGILTKRK